VFSQIQVRYVPYLKKLTVPEALDQVFVPFYTTKKGGSGIGLSLSRQIMWMHHGQLMVSSTPDRETTFTLLF